MKKVYLAAVALGLSACTTPHSATTTQTGTVHFGKPIVGGGCSGDGICNINNSSTGNDTYMAPFAITCQSDTLVLLSFKTSEGGRAGFIVPENGKYYVPLGFQFTNFSNCCANNMYIADSTATYLKKGDSSILAVKISKQKL